MNDELMAQTIAKVIHSEVEKIVKQEADGAAARVRERVALMSADVANMVRLQVRSTGYDKQMEFVIRMDLP